MCNKQYLELLKTARNNARRQYVLACTPQEKNDWLQHSIRLFEKISVVKQELKNENNR